MVEDEDSTALFWMNLAAPGETDGAAIRVPLPDTFTLKDMEGIAIDSKEHLFVISSHSLNSLGKPRRGSALVRMKWMPEGRLSNPEAVLNLRDMLETAIPEIAAVKNLSADDGGLNIEGLAWDAEQVRLLLGLRGPLFAGHPAMVPIRIKNPSGPFRADNLEVQSPIPLRSITDFGIRSVSRDPVDENFWILTGGGGDTRKTKNRFQVWRWDGRGGDPELLPDISFDKKIKVKKKKYKLHPEGICSVYRQGADGQRLPPFLFVVTDASPCYFKFDYPEK